MNKTFTAYYAGTCINKEKIWHGIKSVFSDRRKMIRFETIDENTKNLEEIKQLYFDAFPFEERIPFYIMVLVGNDRGVEFLSIYDDDKWLGFIHTLV